MNFAKWLDTFLSEKGIDGGEILEIPGPSGTNFMPVDVLANVMKAAKADHKKLRTALVRLDFANGDIRRFLCHLGKAVAL